MFNFFYSFITLIIAIFFIILGLIAILIPLVSGIKAMILSFLAGNSLLLLLFGLAFLVIGAALALHILLSSRVKYVTLRSGQNGVLISKEVLESYLTSYWKELFPNREIPCRLVIKKRKIEVIADLPYMPLEEQKVVLEKIDDDLGGLFRDILGYRDELDLSVSFQNEPKT